MSLKTEVEKLRTISEQRKAQSKIAFHALFKEDRELAEAATNVFDDPFAAIEWFSEPLSALGERMPLEACVDGERESIFTILLQMEHGIIS